MYKPAVVKPLVYGAILATVLLLPAHAAQSVPITSVPTPSVPTTPLRNHQPIKATVVNPDPARYTINVKNLANLGVNEEAPTYAMYVGDRQPKTCGDFSKIDIDYKKPDKYRRIFDLRKKPEVLAALKKYGCVVIPNRPSHPPADS